MRHKWDWQIKSICVDGGCSTCIKCGMIKQYVAGKATYFLNDNVYLKAPKCKPIQSQTK